MDAKLILTIGIPGSGKSYWAEQQRSADPENVVVVERDQIRERLFGDRRNHSDETLVTYEQRKLVDVALFMGYTVIVSDTNLRGRYRRPWRKLAEEHGVEYEEVRFDTPYEVCLERNANRPDPVPVEVMERMKEMMG